MPAKSTAEGFRVYIPGQRPPPPTELTPEQATVWTMVVEHLPAAQITPEMFPILIGYCRAVVYADEFAQWLNENPPATANKTSRAQHRFALNSFLALQKQISSFAVKLRLTPQSRYLPKFGTESKARREADAGLRSGKRPWDIPYETDEPGGNA